MNEWAVNPWNSEWKWLTVYYAGILRIYYIYVHIYIFIYTHIRSLSIYVCVYIYAFRLSREVFLNQLWLILVRTTFKTGCRNYLDIPSTFVAQMLLLCGPCYSALEQSLPCIRVCTVNNRMLRLSAMFQLQCSWIQSQHLDFCKPSSLFS